MKKAILFLNGEPPSTFPNLSTFHKIYCTDGAYTYLKNAQIIPDFVVGDLDSVTHNQFDKDVTVIHRREQDTTDFGKALQLIESHGFNHLDIFGSTGQEHDHFLGNISTALAYKNRFNLIFHDDYSTFHFTPNKFELTNVLNKTISLIPVPFTKKVNSTGLQYPLNDLDLEFGKQIGTRNHAVSNTVKISYESGELLIFISNEVRIRKSVS